MSDLRFKLQLNLTSGVDDFSTCAGDANAAKFTENRALFGLVGRCKPGNGTADGGNTTANDFRALFCCSGGFLYNGFENSAKSLSENCSPQSQTGRSTKRF